MLFFGQKCDKELVGQAGGQTGGRTLLHVQLRYFFPSYKLPKTYIYYVTFVWSSNIALWDISLYQVE